MEEIRTEIWDLLFRAKAPKSISEIAAAIGQDAETVRMAVDHEWFTVENDVVNISRGNRLLIRYQR